jgi:DNA-binding NtrC family response regulator
MKRSSLETPESANAPTAAVRILIIEDDAAVAEILERVILSCGAYEVRCCREHVDLGHVLTDHQPDLVFTDLVMPRRDGFEVIRELKRLAPDLPVVAVTAYSTLDNAVQAVKEGAFDFLPKPFSRNSVELTLEKARRDGLLRARARELSRLVATRDPALNALIGTSPAMESLRERILLVRDSANVNVLVEGESGTGKELVARALHGAQGPFVAINMAAIPDELAESELFGVTAGAYTGATAPRRGLIVEAHGGTLFLDEINAASPRLQAKLLRVIEERSLRPLGSNENLSLEFRLIAATNQDLNALVERGTFRRDLYFRLRVVNLRLVPLRERVEDIPALAEHFLSLYARSHGRRVRRFAPGAVELLKLGTWGGNVRELENVIEQAVILSPPDAGSLGVESIRSGLSPPASASQSAVPPGLRAGVEIAGHEKGSLLTLAEMERRYVRQVLESTGGNKTEAARILRIDYKTLARKLD